MTSTQRNAISHPAKGLLVADTSLGLLYKYESGWAPVGGTTIYTGNGSLSSIRTVTLSDVNSLTFKNGAVKCRGFNNSGGSADKYFSFIALSADSTNIFRISNDNSQTLIRTLSTLDLNDVTTLSLPNVNGFILSNYASGTYTRFNFGNTPAWITNTTWNFNGNVPVNLGLGGTADAQFHIVGQDHSTTKALSIENDIGQFALKILNDLSIIMEHLPTSSAGLGSHIVWNNGGVLNITP
jgi:hypothetical protein